MMARPLRPGMDQNRTAISSARFAKAPSSEIQQMDVETQYGFNIEEILFDPG